MIIKDLHRSRRGTRYSISGLAQLYPSAVTVSWSWFDQSQGIVEWTFKNLGSSKESVILLRNGYYFGGAFGPVYLANSTPLCSTCTGSNGFGVSWIYTQPVEGGVSLVNGSIPPLVDHGSPAANAPPMAPVQFPSGEWLNFAFIFTLNPGQTWSMLEGGFSTLTPPYPQGVYQVSLGYGGSICVGYDPQRVKDWDAQTGTNLQGYSPNPSTFNIAKVKAAGAPYDILPFNDPTIQLSAFTQPSPQPSTTPSATPQTQHAQPTPEQVKVELSRMGSRRLRDLGTALLAKDVEQGLTPLEKEMLNAIFRILEERGENVGRMIHERLIQGYRWSVRTYYGNEVAYSHTASREEAEKLAERLRKTGVRAEVVPFRREYIQ